MLVLAIQFELFVRAIVRVLAAVLLVATLLRDGLFDPGGIGLPPSLPYKADFVSLAAILIVRYLIFSEVRNVGSKSFANESKILGE
jgi:hypothetical protein